MPYTIEFTEEAKRDLAYFTAHERKNILHKVREQLSHEPDMPTRNRKPLRDNPVAPWELRIGHYRVFYQIERDVVTVGVVAVGRKRHNALYIRGKQVKL